MQVKDFVATAATAEDKIGGQYQKHVEETPENQVNQRIAITMFQSQYALTMQVKDLVALTISTSLNEIMEEADTQALSIDIH